jgi:hypothetical protein
MIRERGEPAIADTSKPIIEPPVFPDYPENTQTTRPVAQDPDLVGGDDDDEDVEDLTDDDDTVVDEFDDDVEDREVVIEDGDEIIDADDDDDDL